MRMTLFPLILALLTVSVSAEDEAQAEKVPVKIDCEKDCADFVAAKLDAEKAASSELLVSCRAGTEKHEKTIASLNEEIQTLQANLKTSGQVENELRQINRDLEASWATKDEAQKVLLAKAKDLAKTSQQQVTEATLEIKELTERLALQRINFKGMWDDLMAMWKKLVAAVKKAGAAKDSKQTPDF